MLLCLSVLFGATHVAIAEEPAPKGLPRLGDPNATEEVQGTIADSTRGSPGPVRLVLRVAGGRELAVLVAPDKTCDALGLSLRPEEDVTVVGRLITTGERPLLVTEAVVVDGERVAVRDPQGGWVKASPPEAGAEASPAATGEAAPKEDAAEE